MLIYIYIGCRGIVAPLIFSIRALTLVNAWTDVNALTGQLLTAWSAGRSVDYGSSENVADIYGHLLPK